MPETAATRNTADELEAVVSRRRSEALEAGLTLAQANEFAESDADIGLLRRLTGQSGYGKQLQCPVDLLAKIL